MVGTRVKITKNATGSLKNLRKTQKKVAKRIQNREGFGTRFGTNGGKVGDELAKLSGIPSAQRRRRPKDDPFAKIGL